MSDLKDEQRKAIRDIAISVRRAAEGLDDIIDGLGDSDDDPPNPDLRAAGLGLDRARNALQAIQANLDYLRSTLP